MWLKEAALWEIHIDETSLLKLPFFLLFFLLAALTIGGGGTSIGQNQMDV